MGCVPVEFEPRVREGSLGYAHAIAPFSRGERVDVTEPEDQVATVDGHSEHSGKR
jgi:hypothetical protein